MIYEAYQLSPSAFSMRDIVKNDPKNIVDMFSGKQILRKGKVKYNYSPAVVRQTIRFRVTLGVVSLLIECLL